MKAMITLFFLILLTGTSGFAQRRSTGPRIMEKSTTMVYSEDEEALVYKNDNNFSGPEILIESLPLSRKSSIPLMVHPDLKGQFSFKKHPALLLPDYFTVTIEDKQTGEVFDLRSAGSLNVSINEHVSERFVLHMSLSKTTATAMR